MKYQIKNTTLVITIDTADGEVMTFINEFEKDYDKCKKYFSKENALNRTLMLKGMINLAHELALIDVRTRHDMWKLVDELQFSLTYPESEEC